MRVNILGSIEGRIISEVGDSYLPQTRQRVHELGLDTLVRKKDEISESSALAFLDKRVIELSSSIKNKVIYNKNDAINAIRYLEVFCLYAAQFDLVNQLATDPNNLTPSVSVNKAIKELESLRDIIETGSVKGQKDLVKGLVEAISKHVGKVLDKKLNESGKKVNAAPIALAQKILKRLV